jgi:branched-chain amino acid transport system ATP-binding protein
MLLKLFWGIAMLKINDLVVNYGKFRVIKGISLTVGKDSLVAVIGVNGSGKTTLLHSISGLLPITSGTILFDGDPIVGLKPHEIVKRGLVQCPEGRYVVSTLSVRENLLLGAFTRKGKIDDELNLVFELFPILAERQKQPAGTLSGGEQQMLAIARTLMARPKLLLLDEVTLGLAPVIIANIHDRLAELRQLGLSILLAEQNVMFALSLADKGYILTSGSIFKEGSAQELRNDKVVREAYLGT